MSSSSSHHLGGGEKDMIEEAESSNPRKRTLTKKGLSQHIETKKKICTAKRTELTRQRRSVLQMKGECTNIVKWKKEFGKAQILWDEFNEICDDLISLIQDAELANEIVQLQEKVHDDWEHFEQDVRAEIEYMQHLEEIKAENMSAISGSSKKSGRSSAGIARSKSSRSSTISSRAERIILQREEATLKAKLAFSEEERRLKLQRLEEERRRLEEEKLAQIVQFEQEEKLQRLLLKKELAEKQAQLNVCLKAEREDHGISEHDLASVPTEDKEKDLKTFFDSQKLVSPKSPTPEHVSFVPSTSSELSEEHTLYSSHHEARERGSLDPNANSFVMKGDSMADSSVSSANHQHRSATSSQENEQGSQSGWEKVAGSLEKCIRLLATENSQQTDANRKLAMSSQLPKITIPVFSGDPLQFPLWKNAFNSLIDFKPLDVDTKMNYLNQFVSGKPKEIVEHYLLIGTDDAYQKARDLLTERYGNSSVVGAAFINKLEQWPKIPPRDAPALREFSDFLGKIDAARNTVPSLGVLDYAKENARLVEKVPFYLDSKWRDVIERWRSSHGEGSYPPFSEFAEFIRKASNKANMPELEGLVKSRDSQRPSGQRPGRFSSQQNRNSAARSFATTTSQSDYFPKRSAQETKDEKSCPHCKRSHLFEDCEDFLKKSYIDRKNFFFRKRLCMGCGESSQHQVKDCVKKKRCKKCSGTHLTCLHRNIPEELPRLKEVTSNCTSVCSIQDQDGREHSMIVPVWVRHESNPAVESLEYAILDDQSNVGFVSVHLCERLGLSGPETELLLSTMQEKNRHVKSRRITGLQVMDYNREQTVHLPMSFTRKTIPANRSQIPKPEVAKQWKHLQPIATKLMPYNSTIEISLLIGNNCPKAVRPREIIAGGEDDPYGQKSLLGWGIIGNVCQSAQQDPSEGVCYKTVAVPYPNFVFGTKVKEIFDSEKVLRALESDFSEKSPAGSQPYSVEDEAFLNILENGIRKREDSHYEMPLPLKSETLTLPYNRCLAEKRWSQLRARFKKNPKFYDDYRDFMKDVISQCAEKVPTDRLGVRDGRINDIPHTGVYHPKKPDKIRVVFDCSARFEGVSLNDHLLQGPDLTNGLLGVLCRFRQEEVAFMVDVKSMFHQFFVAERYRDLLRFLWWEDGDPNREVIEYRMTVHLFGAGSSPGCANFGLKRAADDAEESHGVQAANFIRRDFYVDDGLKSVPTVEEAITLIKASQAVCSKAGLKLHRISSNRREVLDAVPEDERAKGLMDIDLKVDPLPMERVLGVTWCIENDNFEFRIELRDRPFTRRGILSTVSSIYDPNGYVAPVTLKGKQILQAMCRDKLDWDSPIPESLRPEWERWRQDIHLLEKLKIPRCFKPKDFGDVSCIELHHFSDASQDGYGQCSYVRQVNSRKQACISFVIGKARVTPLKHVTIPRLELAAATISAKMSEFLRAELTYQNVKEYFWTDSKIVLGYVRNEAKRFHVYVANRVQQIRESTDPESWQYVETTVNPADQASRGMTAKQMTEGSRCNWLSGPDFLSVDGPFQSVQSVEPLKLNSSDPEVRSATVLATHAQNGEQFPHHFESSRLERFSSWHRARKAVALCLHLKSKFRNRAVKQNTEPHKVKVNQEPNVSISVMELQAAERAIIRCVQLENFKHELQVLQSIQMTGEILDRKQARVRNMSIRQTSSLFRLDPFLDEEDIMRVGGRIDRANLPQDVKHPIILPRKSHMSELLIRHVHQKVNHMGRGITHNELRQRGYWVIGGSSAVSHLISKCVTCKRLRGSLQCQKMAELPEDRLQPAPPFSYCAVDYFGPFYIKERRSEVKRWGVLFTCMASRSVHLETANSLTASSFINALNRFLSRRGPIRQLRSDQGTTFIGARNELKESLAEMDQERVKEYLLERNCEWITFKMNVPHSSHMGGVWERQIGTVRCVLDTLLMKSGNQLDDESFRTFMTEVESIINSRPLTTDNLCSPDAPEPLTPNHLLTMKPKIVLPPPGNFQQVDVYSRRWWRRVQYLANEFWLRWRKEFLQHLQTRQKWVYPERNLMVGDIVISKERDEIRNQWPLARVEETYPSVDGRVRKVKLLMANGSIDNQGKRQHSPSFLDRPVHKLVLLMAAESTAHVEECQETKEIPDKEPTSVKKSASDRGSVPVMLD